MHGFVRTKTTETPSRSKKALLNTAAGGLALFLWAFASGAEGGELARMGSLEAGALRPSMPASQRFWDHWGDGKAEIDAYRLRQPRYGEARPGTVVWVFVTEPFSYEARVKADPGRHPDSDVFQVLKLNATKDFQTGVYDYNLMTSVFVPVSPHPRVRVGSPTKVTFSSQEWCGMTFEALTFEPDRVDRKYFSYFDGEGDGTKVLPNPEGGLSVEALPIVVRGLLNEPPLRRGDKADLPILSSVERSRLLHRPLRWTKATLSRGKAPHARVVPAGRFKVDTYTAALATGERFSFEVETAYPHRIVAFEGPDGEKGELVGTKRLPYWSLNGQGQERYLRDLGLEPAPHPSPKGF